MCGSSRWRSSPARGVGIQVLEVMGWTRPRGGQRSHQSRPLCRRAPARISRSGGFGRGLPSHAARASPHGPRPAVLAEHVDHGENPWSQRFTGALFEGLDLQVKGSVKLVQKDSAAAEDDAPTRGAISEPRRTPVPPTPPAPASPEGLRRRAIRQGRFRRELADGRR